MTYKIRAYTHNDMEELVSMVTALYDEDKGNNDMNPDKILNTISYFRKNPDAGAIDMIEMDGSIAGYAIRVNYYSNEYGGLIVHIDELYIKNEFRNMGAGTNYIKHVMHLEGFKAVMLETTPHNKAFEFYERLGFTMDGNKHLIYERKEK